MKKYKNMRDSYKLYKSTADNPVDSKTYLEVAALYNKFLMDKVIDEREEVVLPARIGTLCVVGKKQKIRFNEQGELVGLAPAWVKTKAFWESNPEAKLKKKLLYHTNEHSNYIRYKFIWSKKHSIFKNKSLFSVKLTRANKRRLHKKIMKGTEYITK